MSALAMAEKVERFYGNPEAAALIRSQYEAITKLRLFAETIKHGLPDNTRGNLMAAQVLNETESLK